jgi:transcriptional regulator with XRE-family HTH domain
MARNNVRYVNEGQRLLAGLGLSTRALGKALGVSHETAGRYARGAAVPPPDTAARIHAIGGPHPNAWHLAPEPPPDAPEPSPAPEGPLLFGSESELHAVIAQLREARRGASGAALVKIVAAEIGACTALAKIESITDERLRNSAELKRVIARVVDALTPWPDALLAVAANLE